MIKNKCVVIVWCLFYYVTVSHCWDIAVTSGTEINFLFKDGTYEGKLNITKNIDLSAIAFDSITHQLFVVNSPESDKNFISTIPLSNPKILNNFLINEPIQSIAYDPVTTQLFWAEKNTIKSLNVQNQQVQTLFSFTNETPKGVAVDSCTKLLFWINVKDGKSTIERSTIFGMNRTVVIHEDMFVPTAIAVESGKIYWADDTEGIYFRIESANFDGTNRTILTEDRHQQPYGITVTGDDVFWTDWTNSAVWSLPKNSIDDEPTMIYKFPEGTRMSITSKNPQISKQLCTTLTEMIQNYNESTTEHYLVTNGSNLIKTTTLPQKICQNNGTLTNGYCKCPEEFTGQQCEISICHNFCLHGKCVLKQSQPECECELGYLGVRCEIDMCNGYCLNNGICNLKLEDGHLKPECKCLNQFVGERCEQRHDMEELCQIYCEQELYHPNCNCLTRIPSESWISRLQDPIVLTLLITTLILTPTCMALLTAVCYLKKRKRIKRRIIVNKNVTPLTCRPIPPPDQCEITIENCCNMNICETPCFEPPQLRSSKQGKSEEKKTLLTSMEGEDIY